MKSIINKLLVGFAGLALASVPLAASAQDWGGHGHDRGAYRGNADREHVDNRGGGYSRGGYSRGGNRYRVGYARPFHRRTYANGYFGPAPAGFNGYYWNGGWYHHRRWNGGVWLYF